MTVVAMRLKQRRLELGYTVDELAAKVGMSRATLYRYENGTIDKVSVHKLKPIAEALMTTPAWLMGWDDAEITPQQKLMNFVQTIPEEKAEQALRLLKAILSADDL